MRALGAGRAGRARTSPSGGAEASRQKISSPRAISQSVKTSDPAAEIDSSHAMEERAVAADPGADDHDREQNRDGDGDERRDHQRPSARAGSRTRG